MDWIRPNLAISEYPSSKTDLSQVDSIVNLDKYTPYKTDVPLLHIPLLDGPGNAPEEIVGVLRRLHGLTSRGKVLVHCAAGVSRSPFVIALYLAWREGIEFQEALDQVAEGRSRSLNIQPGLVEMSDDVFSLLQGQRPSYAETGRLSAEAVRHNLMTKYMGQHVLAVPSATSTMDLAYAEAERHTPEGSIVVADTQTAGRGRFSRPWVSPPGSAIYLSVILRPKLEWLAQLNMVASLAVVHAVYEETGLVARIKWPNDVEIGERKLSGILIDTKMRGDEVEHSIAGIGLNTNLDPSAHPEIADIATSLSRELRHPVNRLPVLRELLRQMERLYDQVKGGESLVTEWRSYVHTLGRRVRASWPADSEEKSIDEVGVAEDVDDEGALLLRRDDGSMARLIAGEISLRVGRAHRR